MIYFNLFLCTLIPISLSVLFYCLLRYTKFNKLPEWLIQLILGVIFGGAAILGTVFGVDVGGGALANARDAAPLCAGLIFGGTSGFIAGFIGGLYRLIFGIVRQSAKYSMWACSISTFLSGIYAALIRRFVFDNKRPSPAFGFASGVVMESVHLIILFLTHMGDSETAFNVVKVVAVPMISANAFAVCIACLVPTLLNIKNNREKLKSRSLTYQAQAALLITVILGYFISTGFIYSLQTNTARNQAIQTIQSNISDIKDDVENTSNNELREATYFIKLAYENATADERIDPIFMQNLCDQYGVNEINIVGSDNIIYLSNVASNVGFDMHADEGGQSDEFTILNDDPASVNNEVMQAYQMSSSGTPRKYCGMTLSFGGYIQCAYSQQTFHDQVLTNIQNIATYRHVGTTGMLIVADEQLRIVSTFGEYKDEYVDRLVNFDNIGFELDDLIDETGNVVNPNKTHVSQIKLNNTKMMYMVDDIERCYIIALLPIDEVYLSRDAILYTNSFLMVIVFAAVYFLVYSLIKRLVVDRIAKVNDKLTQITEGNLNIKVDVRGSNEFDKLSDDINSTVDKLKDYIEEAASRIDKELEFAKNIQSGALPSVFPPYPNIKNFDIFATMNTAKEVGGDFYDFYTLGDNKVAFLIADVSGKGIPAAMFMMESKTMLKNYAESGIAVNKILTKTNDGLCVGNDAGMFVTCWMGILNYKTGEVSFANAGHNKPLIYRKGEGWSYLNQKAGFVLAGLEGFQYKSMDLKLNPGDKIYLYTDGVTEATTNDERLYGEERLINFLNSHVDLSINDSLLSIKKDLDEFVEGAPQFDDITMLMIEYKG